MAKLFLTISPFYPQTLDHQSSTKRLPVKHVQQKPQTWSCLNEDGDRKSWVCVNLVALSLCLACRQVFSLVISNEAFYFIWSWNRLLHSLFIRQCCSLLSCSGINSVSVEVGPFRTVVVLGEKVSIWPKKLSQLKRIKTMGKSMYHAFFLYCRLP